MSHPYLRVIQSRDPSFKSHTKDCIEVPEIYEPRCEKTSLRGLQPGPAQTGVYSHGRCLEP